MATNPNLEPVYQAPVASQPAPRQLVGFDFNSIIGSPFTWMVVGGAVAWWLLRDKKTSKTTSTIGGI